MIERLTTHQPELARITLEMYDSFQKHENCAQHLAANPNHRHGHHFAAGALTGNRKKNVSRFFAGLSTPACKSDRTTIVDGYHKERDLPTLHLLLEISADQISRTFSDAVLAQHMASLHSIIRTTRSVLVREKAQLEGIPNKTESFIKLTEKRIELLIRANERAEQVLKHMLSNAAAYTAMANISG